MKRTEGNWLMPRVHLVLSQKGGVGKTTIAVNLAAVVAQTLGSDPAAPTVMVASIDPQASAVWWANRTDLDTLPFDFEQVDDRPDDVAALKKREEYEHIFIDAPGSLARPAVLARAMDSSDDVVVPLILEPLAYGPTERTVLDMIQPRGLPYRIVRNLWDRRDGRTDLELTTKWLDTQGFRYTNTVIRKYKMHSTASAEGRVCTQYPSGRTASEAQNDFLQLALELGYGGTV
ncbi:ParA family protein [Amycolatopsis sp. TNS106]|uniref:ParA family protein n=1 Tax=Amycolatopsis sp. TNS106 TaxID=2861750 RepID=UPI00210217FC|nr:ParA family protein [Amycolatopsis sp. TNS106]